MATTGDETLLDEQRRRIPAAVAAIAAGILTILGGGLAAGIFSDRPTVYVLDALGERFAASEPQPGLKALQVRWFADNSIKLILAALVLALAAWTIAFALSQLYRSVKARRPELSGAVLLAALGGGALVGLAGLAQTISQVVDASAFADSADQTSDGAPDLVTGPLIVAAQLAGLLGQFSLGLAFVLLALNGMRVGLLTRFMGVLGMIVGVLFIIPLGSSLPIVQTYWLIALGILFLGRWPSGMPPAWVTGEAQPWPSQQELREARMAKQAAKLDEERPRRGRRERAEPPETPAPELPERKPHSSSKKRKRKRR